MSNALLFDLDGTLFDSTEANVLAYKQAFCDHDVEFAENLYRQCFGLRFPEMMAVLSPGIDPAIADSIKLAKVRHYQENLHLVRQNQELIDLLHTSSKSHKTALVTTASRDNVINLLAYFGLPECLFDVVITGEDVSKGKPDPECYLIAIKKLDTKPEECCIYEDSDVGIEAAKATGAKVVRVKM